MISTQDESKKIELMNEHKFYSKCIIIKQLGEEILQLLAQLREKQDGLSKYLNCSPDTQNFSSEGPTKFHCHQGSHVQDINSPLPKVLANYSNIVTIVTHVGFNDIRFRQYEELKKDYILLISLVCTGKRTVISGPLPCYRRGSE
jgi:hypothetical protein